MYSKQEASILTKKFWTSFGQYMKPIPGASGEEVNWINYSTGIKNIYFRMETGKCEVSLYIEINHPDHPVRNEYFDQLLSVKAILENEIKEVWIWEKDKLKEGRIIDKIGTSQKGLNVMNESDWPSIISFFKPRLMSLDRFWSEVKDAFD